MKIFFTRMLQFLIIGILLTGAAFAGEFEGKIIQRQINIPLEALSQSGGISADDIGNPQQIAARLFSKSIDELKQMVQDPAAYREVEEGTSDIFVKGNKFRIDTEQGGQKISVIYDVDKDQIINLDWKSRQALITSTKQLGQTMKQIKGHLPEGMREMQMAEQEDDLFSVKPTGKTKTINGFRCELFEGTDSDGNYTHIWLSRDRKDLFQKFMKVFSVMEDVSGGEKIKKNEEKFYEEQQGLDVLTRTVSGDAISIMEVREIKEQSVPDDLFQVPAGFQQVNMMDMMKKHMHMMQELMQKQK